MYSLTLIHLYYDIHISFRTKLQLNTGVKYRVSDANYIED